MYDNIDNIHKYIVKGILEGTEYIEKGLMFIGFALTVAGITIGCGGFMHIHSKIIT